MRSFLLQKLVRDKIVEDMQQHGQQVTFHARTFVERLDWQDDDLWVEYYAKDPQRFKEITE